MTQQPEAVGSTPTPGSIYQPDLCRRCGRCCLIKVRDPGTCLTFLTPFHCPHLDRPSRLCRVYSRRREFKPDCLNAEQSADRKILPNDCPYVRTRQGYQGPLDYDPEIFWGTPGLAQRIADKQGIPPKEVEEIRQDCLAGTWPPSPNGGTRRP